MAHKMINITSSLSLLILINALAVSAFAQDADVEIQTLFTTQQERQLIDANRYKVEPKKTRKKSPAKIVKVKEVIEQEIAP